MHACALEDAVTIADDLRETLDVFMAGAGGWELVLLAGFRTDRYAVRV